MRSVSGVAAGLGALLACVLCAAVLTPEAVGEATHGKAVGEATHGKTGPSSLITPVYSGDFPDPSIVVSAGRYYAYSTQSGGRNIQVMTSSDLVHWSRVREALPSLPAWATKGFTWAPAVTETAAGTYVMFYAAYDASSKAECIGRATSSSPLGPFVDRSTQPFLCQPGLGGSIDPYVFAEGGTDYLLWKNNGTNGVMQGIWAEVLTPADDALVGTPSLLLDASSTWEDGTVEGPAMLGTPNGLYLFFSGNRWSTSSYAIGMVGCDTPLGPCVEQSNGPMVSSVSTAAGPGGPTFFVADNGETLMAYAAWWDDGGKAGLRRALFLDQIDATTYTTYFPNVSVWQPPA